MLQAPIAPKTIALKVFDIEVGNLNQLNNFRLTGRKLFSIGQFLDIIR